MRNVTSTPRAALTVKPSGGDAAMTPASLANGAGRQSTKMDLGPEWPKKFAVYMTVEMAATPTAGNTLSLYANPSSSSTAGTDNAAGCSGADAAYAGYSSNLADSVKQLQLVGTGYVTVQVTTTLQRIYLGTWEPVARYNSFALVNGSGAAFHSSAANFTIDFVRLEEAP